MQPGSLMTFGSLEAATSCLKEIGLPIAEADDQAIRSSVEVPQCLSRLDEGVLDDASSHGAKTLTGTLIALAPPRAIDGRYDFAVPVARRRVDAGVRQRIDELAREVYGDQVDAFFGTPGLSLDGRTPRQAVFWITRPTVTKGQATAPG